MNPNTKSAILTFRVTPTLKNVLNLASKRKHLSRSDFIKSADFIRARIREMLDRDRDPDEVDQ